MPRAFTRRLAASASLLAASACAEQTPQVVNSLSRPALEEVMVPGLDSTGPELGISASRFAVARDGRLAFTGGFDPQNRVLAIVHPNGRVERFGRRGQGPGEFSSVVFLGFAGDDDELVMVDGAARVTVRSRSGKMRSTDLKVLPGIPIRLATDSIDLIAMDFESAGPPKHQGIFRMSVATSGRREIVSAGDSAHAALKARSSVVPRFPAAASRGDRIVIVNRNAHAFQSYDAAGRPLQSWGRNLGDSLRTQSEIDSVVKAGGPYGGTIEVGGRSVRRITEAERRRNLTEDRVARVYAIHFDEGGRLWAFGSLGDTGSFADVYSDTTLIGQQVLPCPLAYFEVSFRGEFLALRCKAPGTDSGMQLRLFRVVEAQSARK